MKKIFLLPMLSLLILAGWAIVSSFSLKKATSSEHWVYTSTDASNFTSAGKYEKILIDPEDNSVCMPGSSKPCVLVEVNSSNDDPGEFQTYLSNAYNQSTQPARDAAVLGDAISQKN